MVDQEYINPFVHVHSKVKAFKDRLSAANKSHADLRQDRLVQESKEMELTDKESSSLNSLTLPPSDPA